MTRNNKILAIALGIGVAVLLSFVFLIAAQTEGGFFQKIITGSSKSNEIATEKESPEMIKMKQQKAELQKRFGDYKVKKREQYGEYEKLTLAVKKNPENEIIYFDEGDSWEAVVFVKDGKIENAPEGYIREIIEKERVNEGDKILSINFYENFDRLNDGEKHENVWVAQEELVSETYKNIQIDGESVPFKYRLTMIDENYRKEFSTLLIKPLN